jgi:endonuclease YncB( thermonuclease family)
MLMVPAVLLCVVVGITDGDTITARCDAAPDAPAQTITVRLAEVDAPEKAQPYGNRSRQHLGALCFKQRAEVRPIGAGGGVDRYERVVAHVSCNGTDANAAQVRAGMAWPSRATSPMDGCTGSRTTHELHAVAFGPMRGQWRHGTGERVPTEVAARQCDLSSPSRGWDGSRCMV